MSLLSRFWDESYTSWLSSFVTCCTPRKAKNNPPIIRVEKQITVLHDQPRLVPPPIPEPHYRQSSSREWVDRTKSVVSQASTRASFSVKRKLNAYNGSRRPQIGAPTDFRHVQNPLPRRTENFRPLELSIYLPSNRLSSLLPHFGDAEDKGPILPFPPVLHTRSPSAMSNFSIPRKPLNSPRSAPALGTDARASSSSEWVTHPLYPRPSLPESLSMHELLSALEEELPRSPSAVRLRSNTEPTRILRRDNEQIERVKSILQEKVELERRIRDIDSIIEERQSVYISSRAPSVFSTFATEDPMPDLKTLELGQMPRPKSSSTIYIPIRGGSFSEETVAFSVADRTDPLPPPLPLALQKSRPPLRKKKSFSHVSTWLYRAEHTRSISIDSVTNTPRPVTSRDGFYQCIDPEAGTSPTVSPIEETVTTPTAKETWTTEEFGQRVASRASVSTVSSLESELEGPTEPTPNSSPGRPQTSQTLDLSRMTTFGEKQEEAGLTKEFGFKDGLRISRVGVAF